MTTNLKPQGDLPLCTNHGAESFGALEGVGKVDPATIFACQLRFLFFFCGGGNSITRRHKINLNTSNSAVHHVDANYTILK